MELRRITLNGMLWVFIDNVFVKGFSFIGSILLAKMLTPNDYGLVAIITIFVSMGSILIDGGLSSSLIRNNKNDDLDYCTIFYLNLFLSLLLYFFMYFFAPFIAKFYSLNILTLLIRVYCLNFILTALSSVHIVYLSKKLNFKRMAYLNMPGVVVGNLFSLLLGYYSFGVWSIVAMFLLPQFFQTIALWFFSGWYPKLLFSIEKLKYHLGFSYHLLLSSLISNITNNFYNLLIGKIYPLKDLGYFDRGKTLSQYPQLVLTQVIGKVTLPIFSELESDKIIIETTFKKLFDLSFLISAPIMIGLCAIAKPLVILILGEKWLGTIPILQIISIGGAFYIIEVLNINLIKVYGRSDLILKKEIVSNLCILVTVFSAYFIGFYALIWGITINSILTTLISIYYSNKVIFSTVKYQFKIILIVLFNSFLMFCVMYFVQNTICIGLKTFYEFIIMFFTGFFSFLTFSFIFKTPSFNYAIDIIKK